MTEKCLIIKGPSTEEGPALSAVALAGEWGPCQERGKPEERATEKRHGIFLPDRRKCSCRSCQSKGEDKDEEPAHLGRRILPKGEKKGGR